MPCMYMYLHIYIRQSYPVKYKLRIYVHIACMHIHSVKFRPLKSNVCILVTFSKSENTYVAITPVVGLLFEAEKKKENSK